MWQMHQQFNFRHDHGVVNVQDAHNRCQFDIKDWKGQFRALLAQGARLTAKRITLCGETLTMVTAAFQVTDI